VHIKHKVTPSVFVQPFHRVILFSGSELAITYIRCFCCVMSDVSQAGHESSCLYVPVVLSVV